MKDKTLLATRLEGKAELWVGDNEPSIGVLFDNQQVFFYSEDEEMAIDLFLDFDSQLFSWDD